MDVHIFDQQSDCSIQSDQIIRIVHEVLQQEGKRADEVVIHFVTTETICALHARYFNDDSVTDCISFPIDSPDEAGYCVLGEVFVCPKTAIEYARAHSVSEGFEITLYIVHGLLHLLGYEDDDAGEEAMRAAEKLHMKNLERHNLVLNIRGSSDSLAN